MRTRWVTLGRVPQLSALLLLASWTTSSAMRMDPERIAARMRIDEKWDDLEAFRAAKSRNTRQIQPKEINISVTAPLFSSRLFEYGPKAQDSELPQALDVGKKIDLTHPITFYGAEYKTIYILSNGAIGIDANARSYRSGVLPSATRIIAPFWNRNDLRNGGHVYYREVTRGRVIERGQSEIRYQYDKDVKVVSALIVTWDKMQPLNTAALPEENTNTFQAAIFITNNGTFANFIYSNIGWTQGAEANPEKGKLEGLGKASGSLGSTPATRRATSSCRPPELRTSCTWKSTETRESPGEWMFELSEERVISCKGGIKGDTCDQECSAGEWGPDCAHCCHCAEGRCDTLTGSCSKGCATCWAGQACQTRQDKCATKVQCAPNALSFNDFDRCGEPIQKCQCIAGFEGDGYKKCVDIDECSKNSTICHEHATCTNTPGRYFCQCKDGFSGDGSSECISSMLFPYDTHKQLPRKKNSKIDWQLKNPVKIFGETMDKLTITSSGIIATNDVKKDGAKLGDMQVVGIAPFFAPIDLSRGGAIAVQEVEDEEVLRRLRRTIGDHYNDQSFDPKSVLIVTYSNVSDGETPKGNTFQTAIVSGLNAKQEKLTFLEILYKDMPWGNTAEAGILSKDAASSIIFPASGTPAITQLSKLSNVKQPGTWLYRIDKPNLTPCALPTQVPPFCDKVAAAGAREIKPKLPSKLTEEKKEDLTLPSAGVFRIDQPTGTIRPSLSRFAPEGNVMSVTSPPIQAQRATTKATRPRPRFGSTPHRPIVSLANEDFEVGPDAFEATFPPFMTVVPQLMSEKKAPRPDFSIKAPSLVAEKATEPPTTTTTTTARTTTVAAQKEKEETISFAGTFNADAEDETTPKMEIKAPQKTEETEETEEETDENAEDLFGVEEVREVTEKELTSASPTEANSQIFVFSTTSSKAMTTTTTTPRPRPVASSAAPPRRPPLNIVTAPTNKTPPVAEEQSDRKLAIILPVAIIAVWMLILIFIALFVVCKKRFATTSYAYYHHRDTSSQLRAMYGPAYGVRPTSYEIKRKDSTYEDHLDRAARLSGQPQLQAQQAGKISLYGSYWNLHQHSPPGRPSSQDRLSPHYSNHGYTNPTRYNYAGHY
ncbi:unnamed protein product [Caenorhabditis auriculariae]|uniref:EGF-like domain-containing protein n=1 Tax=Caenorhabditis auriculariae TaxID=2777116 RepID=A0A8S1HG25_9PELO|nr:unnamed protein product [Caenorhabditis auriculariae]